LTLVFVVVNLACRGAAEDFELEFAATVIFVYVESLRDMDLLLLLLLLMTLLWLDELLDVCVHVEERALNDIDHDVSFTDIDQHVIFENLKIK